MIIVDHFVRAEKAKRQQAKPAAEKSLIEALKNNAAPEQKSEGDKTHKLQDVGIEPTEHLSVAEKEAIKQERHQADKQVLDTVSKAEFERLEAEAKIECENLAVYKNGRIDHALMEKLRQIIVKKGGEISWIKTLFARQAFIQNLENERNSKPQAPVSDYDNLQFTYRDGQFYFK